VAGGGTMGAGIAFVAAKAGFAVDLIEPEAAAQDRARSQIAKQAERFKAPDAPQRIQVYASIPEQSDAGLAIEAVPEQLGLKRAIFAKLARSLGPSALLATNTSSLAVQEIAAGIEHPQRVLGLHFFNPPSLMQLVEIVYTPDTGDDEIARARDLVERFGKTAVLAADTPGFIVNRVARPFYLQSLRALAAGAAPLEDLDRLARGAGFRMGPFELMDLIGLDVNLATSESIYERTGADRFEPVALQREMVAQNRLGRKTGAGFYDYSNGAPARDDAAPAASGDVNADEKIVILGSGGLAEELHDALQRAYSDVAVWEDEEALDELPLDATIVIDVGDGANDRGAILERLDGALPRETMIFADAYATDISGAARRMKFPDRLVGYGVLASLEAQRAIEIVDSDDVSDDGLELAQELFESIGRTVVLVEDSPALFLGRVVGSIVNEAVYAVQEDVASPDDIDLAMQLGTNYPRGPLAWGSEIGGDRVRRILQRLAKDEGAAFAPHRALWVLDAQSPDEAASGMEEGAIVLGES